MDAKETLIGIFHNNVKGKMPDVKGANKGHDGKYGHWLEKQFGISVNRDNKADIYGYELKNETAVKTTFGDWSANEYIYTNEKYKNLFKGSLKSKKQDSFVKIFGHPNPEKNNRYSWSGKPVPKINGYNEFGQVLIIDNKSFDIIAKYSYSKDKRKSKSQIVPKELRIDNLELARWYGKETPEGKKGKCLKQKVEDKFNDKGWFTCKRDSNGYYDTICFGKPLNFEEWIDLVRKGIVYFDSGMYEGNPRPYSQWRANNTLWDSLIIERCK